MSEPDVRGHNCCDEATTLHHFTITTLPLDCYYTATTLPLHSHKDWLPSSHFSSLQLATLPTFHPCQVTHRPTGKYRGPRLVYCYYIFNFLNVKYVSIKI